MYFRWRKLGGKDPPTLELIQKIQTLQKRLIARKEDIVDRETCIREKVIHRVEQMLFNLIFALFYDEIFANLLGSCFGRTKRSITTPAAGCIFSR